jgi:hypothetical protein
MNQKKQNDLRWGNENEIKVLAYLNGTKKFRNTLQKTTNTYDTYDFVNHKYTCELKSRRVPHNEYVSAMCGINKVEDFAKGKYPKHKLRMYWLFTDGLYYWDFKKNNCLDYENNEWYSAMGGRFDRGYREECMCCYVWSKYLKKATSKVKSIEELNS